MSAILEDNQIHWDIDHTLTVEELVKLGTAPQVISLDPRSLARVDRAREILLSALDEGKWIYGMSSGFGPLAGQRVERADGSAHQAHLLYHLATGVGERLSARQSRTMCILRLFQLSRGYAGMSTATLQQLLDLYATGMTPMIPSLGSVGASGDLTPLAHAGLGLSGKYRVNHHDTVWEGDTWFTFHHMMPIRWQEGEALAYVNGTACMTALATLALDEGQKAWKQSLWHTFVMGETQAAFKEAWHPLLGQAKSHPGQQLVLEQLTQWGMASQRLQDQSMGTHQNEQRLPQDPYTIRCAPQLLGAVYDQLSYVESVVTREINSASGNPTVFVDEGIIIHGGNFNGQSLAFVADTLTQNLVYMGVYAERRIARMTDPSLNLGLPAYMVREKLGLQSGLMGAQVTASALVAQLRSLATPLAIQSIPTNNSNQDIVSMGTLAAWRSTQCAGILAQILAIEAILLGEAVEIRQEQETCKAFAPITSKWRAELREKIPSLTQDRPLSDEIQMMAEIIREGKGMT